MATDKTDREKAQRLIADNRKAFHDYHVLDSWEAGVALLGTEVKAIREGSVNLRDSYARLENGAFSLLEFGSDREALSPAAAGGGRSLAR